MAGKIRMGVPKDSLEGMPPMPVGEYTFRVDGFKPKASKDKQSTNLNPTLKVINNANGLNDRIIFFNCNTNAGWIQKDFVHSLGLQMEVEGDTAYLPGAFIPDANDQDNVTKLKYEGPMLGRTGRCSVSVRKDDKNRDQSFIKAFHCAVQGCQEKHSTELS